MAILPVLDTSAYKASDLVGVQNHVDGDFFAVEAMDDLV